MEIREILQEYNIEYREHGEHHHATENRIQINCPYCDMDGDSFHMGYHLDNNYVICWRCGYQKLIPTFMELTREPYEVVKTLLEGRIDAGEKHKSAGILKLPQGVRPFAGAHKKYLRKRGYIPKKIARLWGVQGIRQHTNLGWRLFIPIFYRGKVVSWTTRSISDKVTLRYKSAKKKDESIPAKHLLYGEDFAVQTVIVCEGPLDVWKIGPGAVSTFGLGYTTEQLVRIARFARRFICFDAEKKAQKAAKKLCEALAVLPGETYNIKLDWKDPGESPERELEKLRALINS